MRPTYQRARAVGLTRPVAATPIKKSSSPIAQRARPAADKPKATIKAELSAEEEKTYGDRCPSGYRKIKLLGKGGCAVVWLGQEEGTGRYVAMKQVSKSNSPMSRTAIDSCKREIHIGNLLAEETAVEYIAKLLDSRTDRSDIWAIFEAGGQSLSKAVFDLKGEFCKGERIYRITHGPLFLEFSEHAQSWKLFLAKMLEVLAVLTECRVIHSDLKPDNILVTMDENSRFSSLKVIDFGSAFNFDGSGSLSTATPEYMPPEALSLMGKAGDHIGSLKEIGHPWSFDIWSLGMIWLELISGFPLWMSLKSKVTGRGRTVTSKGLLAVQGRDTSLILREQRNVIANLQEVVCRGVGMMVDADGLELLSAMLQWDPSNRVSPRDALSHQYVRSAN